MKRRIRFPISFILFIGGLVLGIRLGIFIAGEEPFSLLPFFGPRTPSPVIPGQKSLLIIGVDRLNAPPTSLQGAWYVAYVPETPVVTLIPLYPSLDKGLNEQLENAFKIQHTNRLSRDFTNLLETTYNFDWDTHILLDDFAMIDLIDLLDGVELNGELQTGSQVVGAIPRAATSPIQALQGQIAVVRSLCARSDRLPGTFDLTEISKMFSPHLVMEINLEEAWAALSDLLAAGSPLTCNVVDSGSP